MKKEVSKIFRDIETEFDRYASTVNDIFTNYKKQADIAKTNSARYKDESGELKQAKEPLIAAARQEIEKADQALHDHVTTYCDALRVALSEHICTAPAPGLVQTLKNYKTFNIEPSRFELDALIVQAGGNYQGLRLIQAVTSKFKMAFPQAEDYEADLDRILKAVRTPVLYTPSGCVEAGHEILPNARQHLPNGSSYDVGQPTAVQLALRVGAVQADREALAKMGERWITALVPEITEFEDVETEDGRTITREHQHAEAVQAAADTVGVSEGDGAVGLAHKLGEHKAAHEAANLDRFSNGVH